MKTRQVCIRASEFSDDDIDRAGEILARLPADAPPDPEWRDAAQLINQWRRLHTGPLTTFRNNLRRRAKSEGIVAGRIKRLPSIISKLQRLSRIRLSEMQDIAGCRAVLPNVEDAFQVANSLMGSRVKHRLVRTHNYLAEPRPSGYRSLHLVYSYRAALKHALDELNVEIQIRTRRQHLWATAVETVGTFTGEALKSGGGEEDWLRFFVLMSSWIAHREGLPAVPGTPEDPDSLRQELRSLAGRIRAEEILGSFQAATAQLQQLKARRGGWLVLKLDHQQRRTTWKLFGSRDADEASDFYLEREMESRERPDVAVVMVSVVSLDALRRTYPNYFTNLLQFRRLMRGALA